MATMTCDCGREISQYVEFLQSTASGDGQQASRGQLTGGTAISKTDLSPLHAGAQGPLSAIVSRLDPFLFEKRKQPLVVLEQSGGEIPNFAISAGQMALRQVGNLLLNRNRTEQQLLTSDLAATKLVPEPE